MAEADKFYRDTYLAILTEWDVEGSVIWGPLPRQWIRKRGLEVSLREIGRLMFEHLRAGGELDQTKEAREPWKDRYDFHFDFRIEVRGIRLYIETVLENESRLESHILVVNMKDV